MHRRRDGIVHLDENDGQEHNVNNDDEHYGSPSPLQSDDLLDSPIRLSSSHSLDAATARRVGRETGAGLRYGIGASIIDQRFDVYLDTVAESDKLENGRDGGEGQKRPPVVLQSIRVVDVACVPESIRRPCKWKHDCNEQAR